MTLIKFCGLTREKDILLAEELGIEFIGFIFVPTSQRCITRTLAAKLRACMRRAKSVGIFMGQNIDEIASINQEVGLDACQIYDAPPSISSNLPGLSIIHAYRNIPDESTLQLVKKPHAILLDGQKNGESSDHERIAQLPKTIRDHVFLAGGLTPENVSHAIQNIRPFAVDVCSGIESSPGIKDPEAMRRFVHAVRSTPFPH